MSREINRDEGRSIITRYAGRFAERYTPSLRALLQLSVPANDTTGPEAA